MDALIETILKQNGMKFIQIKLICQVIEKDSPHPQVEVAFGLTKTNPFPCKPS